MSRFLVTCSLCFCSSLLTLASPHAIHAEQQRYETKESILLNNMKPDFRLEAEILKIVDGDTIKVRMHILPGLTYEVNVRSKGADAPELRGGCDWERQLALEAKEKVADAFKVGEWVYIENAETDKYGGRLAGDIKQWYANQRWRTLAEFLLQKEGRWAVRYDEREGFDWCANIE